MGMDTMLINIEEHITIFAICPTHHRKQIFNELLGFFVSSFIFIFMGKHVILNLANHMLSSDILLLLSVECCLIEQPKIFLFLLLYENQINIYNTQNMVDTHKVKINKN